MESLSPFIPNHRWNAIRRQTGRLIRAIEQAAEPKILEALRYSTEAELLTGLTLTEEEKERLTAFRSLQTKEQLQAYLTGLADFVQPFPALTENQTKKLFPKVKKLKVPEVSAVPWSAMSYWGWTDASAGKHYLVYAREGRLAGIEGTFTSSPKANICCMCGTAGGQETIGYYSVVCRPPAGASQDYYKAIGNYMCLDSAACNQAITDLEYLDFFFQEANAKWQ